MSVSVWVPDGSRKRDDPDTAEREAVKLLRGVGGDHEWWIWDQGTVAGLVGHLRVPLTTAEYNRVPPGCVLHDAGETGPMRGRTR